LVEDHQNHMGDMQKWLLFLLMYFPHVWYLYHCNITVTELQQSKGCNIDSLHKCRILSWVQDKLISVQFCLSPLFCPCISKVLEWVHNNALAAFLWCKLNCINSIMEIMLQNVLFSPLPSFPP
jgi:hypothetical protein